MMALKALQALRTLRALKALKAWFQGRFSALEGLVLDNEGLEGLEV